jgi:hypothetical protein
MGSWKSSTAHALSPPVEVAPWEYSQMYGALPAYLYLRELRFGPNFRRNRTFARYWPDLHAYAVR